MKAVPSWTEEFGEMVRCRNRAFSILKRMHNFQHQIQYKQALVKRTIRQAKRSCWCQFCDTIGSVTPVGVVWVMIKRMSGVRREWDYPVLTSGKDVAVTDEKAAMHSSAHLSEEEQKGREEDPGVLDRREDVNDALNAPFTMAKIKRAIGKPGLTSPGKDEVCYVMLAHLSDEALDNYQAAGRRP